jgi:hypothetical protein
MRSVKLLFAVFLLCGAAFAQGVAGDPETGDFQLTGGGAGTWSGQVGIPRVTAFAGGHCVISATVTAGDEAVIFDNDGSTGTATLGITDSLSNTWHNTALCNSTAGGCSSSTYAEWNSTLTTGGADTITITTTGTGTSNCFGLTVRWSAGGLAANPADASNAIQQFTTNHTITTTGNLAANGELVVGGFFSGANIFTAAGSGFTALGGDSASFPTAEQSFAEYKALASGSGSGATQTATAVDTGGTAFDIIVTLEHP